MKLNFKKAAMKTVGVGAGAAASRFIGNQYAKDPTKGLGKPVVKGLLHILAGALLIPTFIKGEIGDNVGNGFIAEGALRIAENKMPDKFGVSGISEDQIGNRDYVIDDVNGTGDAGMGGDDDVSGFGDSSMGAISEDQIGGDDE